jgi:Uma2 family endonuclease
LSLEPTGDTLESMIETIHQTSKRHSRPGRTPAFTVRHYELFPEDGNRHEIVDGDHFMTPAPSLLHQMVSGNLYYLLRTWVRANRRGWVFDAPVDVELGEHDIVQPDLVLVLQERKSVLTGRRIIGAPDLVVEILSPSTAGRDREVKRTLYDRAGVREYWLVDADQGEVTVLERDDADHLESSRTFLGGETLVSRLLPGFQAPLAEIFSPDP